MIRITMCVSFVVFCGNAGIGFLSGQQTVAKPEQPSSAKFEINAETTFVTEPLDGLGGINYAAALNLHHSRGVTPENNSVVLLYQALGPKPEGSPMSDEFFRLIGSKRPPDDGDYILSLGKLFPDLNSDAGRVVTDQFLQSMERPWNADEFPKISQWVSANEIPLGYVAEAVERCEYYSPLVVEPIQTKGGKIPGSLYTAFLPGVQRSREIARVLISRTMQHIDSLEMEQAAQDLITCHRLGRLVGRGPTLVEGMVGVAIESMVTKAELVFIDHCKSADDIRLLKDGIQSLPARAEMAEKIKYGERMMFLDIIQGMTRHGNTVLSPLGAESPALGMLSIEAVDWNIVLRSGNQWYDRIAEAMKVADYSSRIESLDLIQSELESKRSKVSDNVALWVVKSIFAGPTSRSQEFTNTLMQLLSPAAQQVQSASDRVEQYNRNLQVALALAEFRMAHGNYPKTLKHLRPQYLKEIPDDLFAEAPLTYRTIDAGYLLYSVGRDRVDNDGVDLGKAGSGDDLVVRFEQ